MSNEKIEALRAYGVPDDEIAELLGVEEAEEPRSPRTVSEWKRKAREEEAARIAAERDLSTYRRRDQFTSLLDQVSETDRQFLSFDDVSDLQEITPSALKVKAEEKRIAMNQQLEAEAVARGFPNADAYRQALAELAQRAQAQSEQQQANLAQGQAQAGFALGGQPATTATSLRQEVRQLADEGDLESVAERIFGNPQAFSRPLGDDFRPT